jgi:hypothetical protein
METRELKISDIVGYMPYLLKLQCDNHIYTLNNEQPGLSKVNSSVSIDWIARKSDLVFKPIVRPPSDLYKTITHNGKEIVPIVECAKIHKSQEDWKLNVRLARSASYMFGYGHNGFYVAYGSMRGEVFNQYQLFDYLNELKIDYRGLIDAGLAIDCNTLENNPYK